MLYKIPSSKPAFKIPNKIHVKQFNFDRNTDYTSTILRKLNSVQLQVHQGRVFPSPFQTIKL